MKTSIFVLSALLVSLPVLADEETYADVRAGHEPGKIGHVIVIGRLGKPLGTQLKISGQYAERTTNNEKINNPLSVSDMEEADRGGIYFGAAPNVEIRGQKLEKGKHYKLEGYESGEFVGTPDWAAKKNPNEQPFRFQTFFVVTKVIEAGEQERPRN